MVTKQDLGICKKSVGRPSQQLGPNYGEGRKMNAWRDPLAELGPHTSGHLSVPAIFFLGHVLSCILLSYSSSNRA
uniref:Uncharacterized protein n=1 Tax=Salix viminalis TaxID=40686 RepID=A0A6N2N6T5_SALVM